MAVEHPLLGRAVILTIWSVVMGGAGLYFGIVRRRIPLKPVPVTGRDALLGGVALVAVAAVVLWMAWG